MSAPARGSAAVGLVAGLPPVEMAAVLFLRLWCDGPSAQAALRDEAARNLGAEAGLRWLGAFEALVGFVVQFARRPLVRHGLGCRCLGGDESALANLIAAAAEGEREDAMLIGMVLVRPDMAPGLVAMAEIVGLGMKRMVPPSVGHFPGHPTRH